MVTLTRASRLVGLMSLVVVPTLAGTCGWRAAVGFVCGLLWALANVWVMRLLVRGWLHVPRWRIWKLAGLLVLKIPILYSLGAVLLLSPWSSPLAVLAGFSLWFLALWVRAVVAVVA